MVCYNLGKNGYLWLNALLILVKNINMIPLGYEVLSVLESLLIWHPGAKETSPKYAPRNWVFILLSRLLIVTFWFFFFFPIQKLF